MRLGDMNAAFGGGGFGNEGGSWKRVIREHQARGINVMMAQEVSMCVSLYHPIRGPQASLHGEFDSVANNSCHLHKERSKLNKAAFVVRELEHCPK